MNAPPPMLRQCTQKFVRYGHAVATGIDAFGTGEWALLLLWASALLWPISVAFRHKSSLALSLTVGLLLGYLESTGDTDLINYQDKQIGRALNSIFQLELS